MDTRAQVTCASPSVENARARSSDALARERIYELLDGEDRSTAEATFQKVMQRPDGSATFEFAFSAGAVDRPSQPRRLPRPYRAVEEAAHPT